MRILERIISAKNTYMSVRGKVEEPNYIEIGKNELKELEDFYNEISGSEITKKVIINDGSVIMGMYIKKVDSETCLTISKKMKRLVGFSMSDEMYAASAFIKWQQCGKFPDTTIDVGISLKAGKGVPSVVLMDGDVQLAVGFWNIVKYWQEHEFVPC